MHYNCVCHINSICLTRFQVNMVTHIEVIMQNVFSHASVMVICVSCDLRIQCWCKHNVFASSKAYKFIFSDFSQISALIFITLGEMIVCFALICLLPLWHFLIMFTNLTICLLVPPADSLWKRLDTDQALTWIQTV